MKNLRGFCVLLLACMLALVPATAQESNGEITLSQDGSQFEGNPELAIPEFPESVEWINVDGRLTLDDLRGKIIIMDFWTYGCINCIHMIPVLKQLEAKYPDELVVIGVHSAKFENEGQTENIRQIVQRYEIEHPVINDNNFLVWRTFGVRAWPTFMVVDPRGNLLASQGGEIPFEAFDQILSGMIEHFDRLGELNREPLQIRPEGAGRPNTLLAFPGKVRADVAGGRLFIADTNNNRIVIADLNSYEVLEVIGTGTGGLVDGAFEEAQFNKPHGMALKDGLLYVADTNNHAIRALNFETRTVDTIAGTGEMGRLILQFGMPVYEPRAYDLRSPWDVEAGVDNTLFIAMAGTHQIWEMNLTTKIMLVSVGNGREALHNAELSRSELAQPSGLFFQDGLLYFADSESSSIRVADYTNNTVRTLAGPIENTLFDFGDVDGQVGTSRLQHALGVTGDDDGLIYIADTYNNKIKVIDQTTNTRRLYGQEAGFADGDASSAAFYEPGGLDYAQLPDGRRVLFVADTNNHAIRVIDLGAGTVTTVQFPNPQALQIADRVTLIGGSRARDEALLLPTQALSGGEGHIVLRLEIPDGYKLNDIATSSATWNGDDETLIIAEDQQRSIITGPELRVPITLREGEGRLHGLITVYFCEAVNESLCFIDEFSVEVPLSVAPPGGFERDILISRALVPPQLESSVGGIE